VTDARQRDHSAQPPPTSLTPDEALARLKKGNADFLSDEVGPRPTDHDRRLELALSQSPFAVLVGCSDSRVSPSHLFDAELGELFIVRNAGNSVGEVGLGSIQFGVLELGTPLVVVLGHQRCGAVQAAVRMVEEDADFPGSIGRMVEPIVPSVLHARKLTGAAGDDLVEASVRENVRRTVEGLRASAPLAALQAAGRLRIVGAEYSLDLGEVDFFIE